MLQATIERTEAAETFALWHAQRRLVEVRIHFKEGIVQTHPGYVTLEPDGRVVVARVLGANDFFTTVIDLSSYRVINLLESENAITLEHPSNGDGSIKSVTIACRAAEDRP
ncbi:MAG TPA: hypothetical protein VKM94_24395 [Blastocatellia bacterium]|nr:hypothetical protein [Blastocatellia bacterium]